MEAECLKCECTTFTGQFNGYEFVWYCSGCGREFDGHTSEDTEAMSAEDKDYYLKEPEYETK